MPIYFEKSWFSNESHMLELAILLYLMLVFFYTSYLVTFEIFPTLSQGSWFQMTLYKKKKIQTNDTFRTIGTSSWDWVRVLCFFVLWLNLTNLFRLEMPLAILDLLQSYWVFTLNLSQKMKYLITRENLELNLFSLFWKFMAKKNSWKPSFTCIFLADWYDLVWSLEGISYCLRDARTQILVIMCTCSHCFNSCWSNHL